MSGFPAVSALSLLRLGDFCKRVFRLAPLSSSSTLTGLLLPNVEVPCLVSNLPLLRWWRVFPLSVATWWRFSGSFSGWCCSHWRDRSSTQRSQQQEKTSPNAYSKRSSNAEWNKTAWEMAPCTRQTRSNYHRYNCSFYCRTDFRHGIVDSTYLALVDCNITHKQITHNINTKKITQKLMTR